MIDYVPSEFVKVEGMRIRRTAIVRWLIPPGCRSLCVVLPGADQVLEFSRTSAKDMDKIMGVEPEGTK